ncbi:MAG: hypothetical protein ACK559_24455, partial [bacterium]
MNGPTLGLIGEGRDPREYIIPERKMAGAAMNYLSGKRGASVLSGVPRFADGGFVSSSRKSRRPKSVQQMWEEVIGPLMRESGTMKIGDTEIDFGKFDYASDVREANRRYTENSIR